VSPHRTAPYRRRGRTQDKTDETDALAIARLMLADGDQLPRIQRDDTSTELRLLSDHRDNMLVERTRLINQLHGQMLQIDPSYNEKSGRLTAEAGVRYCRDLTIADADDLIRTRLRIVQQLAAQILRLNADIAAVTADLERRMQESQTSLLALRGVGTIVAARVIGELGTTPGNWGQRHASPRHRRWQPWRGSRPSRCLRGANMATVGVARGARRAAHWPFVSRRAWT